MTTIKPRIKPKAERTKDSREEENWTKPVTAGQALKEFQEECARDELISTKCPVDDKA